MTSDESRGIARLAQTLTGQDVLNLQILLRENKSLKDYPAPWQEYVQNWVDEQKNVLTKYSPDQPRDDHGRFGSNDSGTKELKKMPFGEVTISRDNILQYAFNPALQKMIDNLKVNGKTLDTIPYWDRPGATPTASGLIAMGVNALLMNSRASDDLTGDDKLNERILANRQILGREELFKGVDQQLQEVYDKSQPRIQVESDKLMSILEQGRFQTLAEVGSGSLTAMGDVKGEWYSGARAGAEQVWFSSAGLPAEQQPIYGYISDNKNSNQYNGMRAYGDAQITLKPDVLERTTLTIGDSLNTFTDGVPFKYGGSADATGLGNVTEAEKAYAYHDITGKNYFLQSKEFFNNAFYLEAQYHGGLKVSDIKEIRFSDVVHQDITTKLDELGIKWKVGK